MRRKNIVLMRHTARRGRNEEWVGDLGRRGFEMVDRVIEWLKASSVSTCAIYTSRYPDPRYTAQAISAGLPHVKNEILELLSDDGNRNQDTMALGTFLEGLENDENYDTVILITHEPLVRTILSKDLLWKKWRIPSDASHQIPYATTVLLKSDGGYTKFCP